MVIMKHWAEVGKKLKIFSELLLKSKGPIYINLY